MQDMRMGTGFLPWHEMWTVLLQFSPRAPLHGAAAAAAAAAVAAGANRASRLAPPPPVRRTPPPHHAPVAGTGTAPLPPPPRASAVNVVRSMAYTSQDAAIAKLLETGDTYVSDHWGVEGARFWVELTDGDGELRVGLVRRSKPPAGAKQKDGDKVDGEEGAWAEWRMVPAQDVQALRMGHGEGRSWLRACRWWRI